MIPLLRILFAALAVTSGAACFAQFRVIPGEPDADCGARTPARVCLGSSDDHCFAPASTRLYVFGLEPKAVQIGQIDGKPLVLFSAMFSGCGSGTLTDFSLLTVKNGEFASLAPTIRLTNQSEYKLWSLPEISHDPVFATADFIEDLKAFEKSGRSEETHFARHRYHIEAYAFDPLKGRYILKATFDTAKKYKGLDESDKVQILDAEKAEILERLR